MICRTQPEPLNDATNESVVTEDYTDAEYLEIIELDDNDADIVDDDWEEDVIKKHLRMICTFYTKSFSLFSFQSEKHEINELREVICRTCGQPSDSSTAQNLFHSDNYLILEHITMMTELTVSCLFLLSCYVFNLINHQKYTAKTRRGSFKFHLRNLSTKARDRC